VSRSPSWPTQLVHRRSDGGPAAGPSGAASPAASPLEWATVQHAAAAAPLGGASPGTYGGRSSYGATGHRKNTLPGWSLARRPDGGSGFPRRSRWGLPAVAGCRRCRVRWPGAAAVAVTSSADRWWRSLCGAGCCVAPRLHGGCRRSADSTDTSVPPESDSPIHKTCLSVRAYEAT